MEPLLEALQDTDKAVVRRAVEGLVALAADVPEVAGVLDERLRTTPGWPVAYVLGQITRPSESCLEVLAWGLGSRDQDLRWATQLLLTDLGKRYPEVGARLKGLLSDGSATQRRMAVYCLRDIAADASVLPEALLGAVRDPEPLVRVAAVTSLAKVPGVEAEALETLKEVAADDVDARVRNAAAFVVRKLSAGGTP